MSVFFIKGKGWRYEFILNGVKYSKAWFKTKSEATRSSIKRKEEVKNPKPVLVQTPTDITFFELVNKRLDHVKAYYSSSYYASYRSMARRWASKWRNLKCSDISIDMVQGFLFNRKKVSAYAANYDLRCLRSLFNFGMKRGWITNDPTRGISFLPLDKKVKYIPPKEDVLKVIMAADSDTQDYLFVVKETMGRISEINRLTWEDINFSERCVILSTRKKKGGHLTPRKVPMTKRVYEILSRRYAHRDKSKPWVFWHTYWSSKTGEKKEGPFRDRKRIMKALCEKAGVKYFRFHALRHFGASIMDNAKVQIGSIQRILGHENRRTTEIYLHSIGEAEREAMAVYEDACGNKNPLTDSLTEKEKGLR
ncbi:MAG: site-specific integrase [bacterium]